jgi:dTDP-4-dehydrorhamnose 3,5-epimerase
MHFQEGASGEAKLIRCIRGALYDVVVDLRPDSPTFRRWIAAELKAEPGRPSRMLYAPEGFAHGFLTLENDTEVFYQMSEFYAPHAARGFRWNDPAFSIEWPGPVCVISDKDRSYPDFTLERRQVAYLGPSSTPLGRRISAPTCTALSPNCIQSAGASPATACVKRSAESGSGSL